jgi:hypothetical protein
MIRSNSISSQKKLQNDRKWFEGNFLLRPRSTLNESFKGKNAKRFFYIFLNDKEGKQKSKNEKKSFSFGISGRLFFSSTISMNDFFLLGSFFHISGTCF